MLCISVPELFKSKPEFHLKVQIIYFYGVCVFKLPQYGRVHDVASID